MCTSIAFAGEVAAVTSTFSTTWENEILWAPSSSGDGGGSIIHALCAGCHLQLHARYFSLTAYDRHVTWIQMLWSTLSCVPREWLSDKRTLHWYRNGHLSSLPTTEREVWNQLRSRTSITHKTFMWTDLRYCSPFSAFSGEYYDSSLNDNFFRIFNKSVLTVTFPAHSQLLIFSSSTGTVI